MSEQALRHVVQYAAITTLSRAELEELVVFVTDTIRQRRDRQVVSSTVHPETVAEGPPRTSDEASHIVDLDPDNVPSDNEEGRIATRSASEEAVEENTTPRTVMPQAAEGGQDQIPPLYLRVPASQPGSVNGPSWKLLHNNILLAARFN